MSGLQNRKQGFTLIESMIVVVILGILVAIALPNVVSMMDRAKESKVMQNAKVCEQFIEDCAIRSNGVNPGQIASFMNHGVGLRNPFDPKAPAVVDLSFEDRETLLFAPGTVYYSVNRDFSHCELTGYGAIRVIFERMK